MGHGGREGEIDPNEKCGHPVPKEGKRGEEAPKGIEES